MNSFLAILLCAALLSTSTEKERRLRLEYDDIAADAEALVQLVSTMEANLHQQGLALHPDIASARNHLVSAMDSAAEALENQDWNQLRKRLDRARGWVERLRRKL